MRELLNAKAIIAVITNNSDSDKTLSNVILSTSDETNNVFRDSELAETTVIEFKNSTIETAVNDAENAIGKSSLRCTNK